MDIFRAGADGVARVPERDPDAIRDVGTSLLRGGTFAVDGYRVFPIARRDVDDGFGMIAVDRAGDVVLLEFRPEEATGATVGDALADAAAAAGVEYASLNEWYEGLYGDARSLAAAHADAFDRDDPLDPTAFNDDQRLLVFAPAFAEELSAAADFLRSKRVGVHPVAVNVYGDGDGDDVVAFDPLEPIGPDRDAHEQPRLTRSSGAAADGPPTVDLSGATAEPSARAPAVAETDAAADDPTVEPREVDAEPLLEAAYDRLEGRLANRFEGDVGDLLSLETRDDEVLLAPDHPAYAGGVLRYRLRPAAERTAVEFRLDVYGGSDVEKERMRAVLRRYEPDLEEELGYRVADGYDAAVRTERVRVTNGAFDRSEARAVAEEFERLVGFVHPRVMRAWREATE